MANTDSGNIWYVDTQYASAADDLAYKVNILTIIVTSTAANGRIVVSDPVTAHTRLDLRVPTSGATQVFDFSNSPITCSNGIRILTLSNAVVTFIGTKGT